MDKELDQFVSTSIKNQQQAAALVEKLFAVAEPGAVFSEPLTVGERTLITAAEVKVGMGFGFGGGIGTDEASEDADQDSGAGFGGGGGGASGGRPIAAISIGPEGVTVEPIVDVTKIALAFFTALGSMFMMLLKMRKASSR
jgi:uncharacterized spore protein YtfJ